MAGFQNAAWGRLALGGHSCPLGRSGGPLGSPGCPLVGLSVWPGRLVVQSGTVDESFRMTRWIWAQLSLGWSAWSLIEPSSPLDRLDVDIIVRTHGIKVNHSHFCPTHSQHSTDR